MNCESIRNRLLLYLAGELDPQEEAALRRHLENCPRCAAEAEELAETQDLVDRVLRTTAHAPSTLDARVMAAVRLFPAPWLARSVVRFSWNWRRRVAAVSVALCLLAGGYVAGHWHAVRHRETVSALTHPERPTVALALLGDDHLKYLANPQPAQVPGPDPRTVAVGLMPLLKFPVAAVDLHHEGARLLGGRKCEIHGVPIAFLLYDWKGERVSLYQIDARKIALPPLHDVTFRGRRFQVSEVDGLSYVAWSAGAMHFVMVSGAAPERLIRLACSASGMSQPA